MDFGVVNTELMDKRKYYIVFEYDFLKLDQEVIFFFDEDKEQTLFRGRIDGIYTNRKDEGDVWARIELSDGVLGDISIHEVTFELANDSLYDEESPLMLVVNFKKLSPLANLPAYATEGSAAFDLEISEEVLIPNGEVVLAPTGLAVEVPFGFELQIRARSGLAISKRVILANGVGTIDSDYRGEIRIPLMNLSGDTVRLPAGYRAAQGVLAPAFRAAIKEVEVLSTTERGAGGFGSTGE